MTEGEAKTEEAELGQAPYAYKCAYVTMCIISTYACVLINSAAKQSRKDRTELNNQGIDTPCAIFPDDVFGARPIEGPLLDQLFQPVYIKVRHKLRIRESHGDALWHPHDVNRKVWVA